jgi:hypothetical protein
MAIAVGATRQILADAYTGSWSWLSQHTATPGSTGASEASGGGYARKQTTWGSGSNGVTTGSQVTFDLAAGTYTHTGGWTASSAGTFRDGAAQTSTTLNVAGQILVQPTITIS